MNSKKKLILLGFLFGIIFTSHYIMGTKKIEILDVWIVNPESSNYRIVGLGKDNLMYEWNWNFGEWRIFAKEKKTK